MTSEEIKIITDTVAQSVTEKMSELIDEKLKPINERLDRIEEDIEEIKENTEITRTTVNEVVEWIDLNFREDYPFPVGTSPRNKAMKLN